MIFAAFLAVLMLLVLVSSISAAFAPTRNLLAYSLVGLSFCLGMLALMLVDPTTGFWLTAAFFIGDFAVVYLLFSTDLVPRAEEAGRRSRRFISGLVLALVGTVAILAIFGSYTIDVQSLLRDPGGAAFSQNALWTDYWPITLLCSIVASPMLIGALLLVRLRR